MIGSGDARGRLGAGHTHTHTPYCTMRSEYYRPWVAVENATLMRYFLFRHLQQRPCVPHILPIPFAVHLTGPPLPQSLLWTEKISDTAREALKFSLCTLLLLTVHPLPPGCIRDAVWTTVRYSYEIRNTTHDRPTDHVFVHFPLHIPK